MVGISVHARTRTTVLLRTLDVRQDPKKDSGKEEGIRNVEQQPNSIRSAGQRPPHSKHRTIELGGQRISGWSMHNTRLTTPTSNLVSTATLAGVVVYEIVKPAPGSTGIIVVTMQGSQ